MARTRGLEALVGRIYDAAVEPELWTEAIADVADAVGCRSGLFYEHDLVTHRSRPLGTHRLDTDLIKDYEAYYGALDPWNARAMAWPVGVTTPTYALTSDVELRRSEFYQDHLRLTGMFYGVGGVVERSRSRMAVFGVQRGYEDGRFSSETLDLIRGLMPHLRRAYRIYAALDRAERDRTVLEDTLHLVEKPVLILQPDGCLIFANRAAEGLLRRRDGLIVTEGGWISAAHRGDRAPLARAIAAEVLAGHPPVTVALRRCETSRGRRAPPFVALVAPLPDDAARPRRVALLIETPLARIDEVDALAAAFRLSGAETRLWSALVAGQTLAGFAEVNGVSVNTLRVQLGALSRKTGVHRQADLVRLALERTATSN